MGTISSYLAADHRHCDDLFAAAEEDAAKGAWEAAANGFAGLLDAMGRHFAMEEEVLFPAFEQATGSSAGPTQVMRSEHQQMREVLGRMAAAVAGRDADGYSGLSETLLILMQQHNIKEEQILYPMSDRALGAEREQLVQRMEAVPHGG